MEPTPEELEALVYELRSLCCEPSGSACRCEYEAVGKDVFARLAPLVLERAARWFEGLDAGMTGDGIAHHIRFMASQPPPASPGVARSLKGAP